MAESALITNLKRLMAERKAAGKAGGNPYSLSLEAGMSRNFVQKILDGASASPRGKNLAKLAEVLECKISDITGEPDDFTPGTAEVPQTQRLHVEWVAQAGAWVEVDQSQEEPEEIEVPLDDAYPGVRRFLARIHGDSMNKTPLQDRAIAICLDTVDFGAAVPDRSIVIVRRTEDGGHTYETTAKRLRVHKDKFELVPESHNPKHETIVVPKDHMAEDGEIRIIGVVIGAYFDRRALL